MGTVSCSLQIMSTPIYYDEGVYCISRRVCVCVFHLFMYSTMYNEFSSSNYMHTVNYVNFKMIYGTIDFRKIVFMPNPGKSFNHTCTYWEHAIFQVSEPER